jgi:hypothetical protein
MFKTKIHAEEIADRLNQLHGGGWEVKQPSPGYFMVELNLSDPTVGFYPDGFGGITLRVTLGTGEIRSMSNITDRSPEQLFNEMISLLRREADNRVHAQLAIYHALGKTAPIHEPVR